MLNPRVRKIQQGLPDDIVNDMDSRLDQISQLLATIAPETQGINRYRYAYNLSCMEELVEALTFAHYLKTQSLIGHEELAAAIEELARRGAASEEPPVKEAQPDANMPPPATTADEEPSQAAAKDVETPPVVSITEQDYLYGVFDLTGEMMRFATTSTALTRTLAGAEEEGGDGRDAPTARPRTILHDMQDLRSFVEMLPQNRTKQWTNKLDVLRGSVRKVEIIGYGMIIRGNERPTGWVPDAEVDVKVEEE
jgi:hypothetical protein